MHNPTVSLRTTTFPNYPQNFLNLNTFRRLPHYTSSRDLSVIFTANIFDLWFVFPCRERHFGQPLSLTPLAAEKKVSAAAVKGVNFLDVVLHESHEAGLKTGNRCRTHRSKTKTKVLSRKFKRLGYPCKQNTSNLMKDTDRDWKDTRDEFLVISEDLVASPLLKGWRLKSQNRSWISLPLLVV